MSGDGVITTPAGGALSPEDAELLKAWMLAQAAAMEAELAPYLAAFARAPAHEKTSAWKAYQEAAAARLIKLRAAAVGNAEKLATPPGEQDLRRQ